jgi:hypothetical protein
MTWIRPDPGLHAGIGPDYFHTARSQTVYTPSSKSLMCAGFAGRLAKPGLSDVPLLMIVNQAVVADHPAIPAHERGRAEYDTYQRSSHRRRNMSEFRWGPMPPVIPGFSSEQ